MNNETTLAQPWDSEKLGELEARLESKFSSFEERAEAFGHELLGLL